MAVSGQLHSPAALPQGKSPWYPLDRRLGGHQRAIWTRWWREKFLAPTGTRTPDHSAYSPALYHWAITALHFNCSHVFNYRSSQENLIQFSELNNLKRSFIVAEQQFQPKGQIPCKFGCYSNCHRCESSQLLFQGAVDGKSHSWLTELISASGWTIQMTWHLTHVTNHKAREGHFNPSLENLAKGHDTKHKMQRYTISELDVTTVDHRSRITKLTA
jgi:hypothetical protein